MGIYTEEDIQKAYAIGYNEAVDDVNEYIDQESMEYNLDDEMNNYNEDYSAVEDMIINETKTMRKQEHNKAMSKAFERIRNTHYRDLTDKDVRDNDALSKAYSLGIRDYNTNVAIGNERANKNLALHPGRSTEDKGYKLKELALKKYKGDKNLIKKAFA